MFENIEQVRRLWRGESVTFEGPRGPIPIKTLPKPVQPELPVWITAASNPDTFRKAGEIGAGILTHILGQTLNKVGANIELYRDAWKSGGRVGKGHVTLMLHTFVAPAEEEAKSASRAPMKNYLKSAMGLVRDAAWEFPTFQKFSAEGQRTIDEYFEQAEESEIDDLLEFAFERYYNGASLLGSVEKCVAFVDELKKIGVDEVGCLVDFGIDEKTVMAHLPFLNEVREASNATGGEELSLSQSLLQNKVTHLQCTPSRVSMILYETDSAAALGNLDCLMIGGEPLAADLVERLQAVTSASIFNMYGPTETTIWSTVSSVGGPDDATSIGTPLTNQSIHVMDRRGLIVPPETVGELAIGGLGVSNGYLNRPKLNQDRFAKFKDVDGSLVDVYKTGDMVYLDNRGHIEFLGRADHTP